MECNFCGNIFSNKYSLSKHQKTVKKCIKIQQKDDIYGICRGCNKEFKKELLDKHQNSCKNIATEEMYKKTIREKDMRIKYLEGQIKDLQDQLGKIAEIGAKKSTITNNFKISNKVLNQLAPFTLSKEKIAEIVEEKFDLTHLIQKDKGLAKFAVEHILTDNDGKKLMLCTDPSRKLFIYKSENGEIYKDPSATQFTEWYIPPIEKKSGKIYKTEMEKESTDDIEMEILNDSISMIGDVRGNHSILSTKLAKKLVPTPEGNESLLEKPE